MEVSFQGPVGGSPLLDILAAKELPVLARYIPNIFFFFNFSLKIALQVFFDQNDKDKMST
jgi:hypothetical protein